MRRGISASTIKSWFQYRCERKVRYELSSDAELAAVPVAKDVREQAWAVLGQEFEARVVRRLHGESGVLSPAPGDDALSERLTGAFLRGKTTEPYAAQVNLKPVGLPSFLEGTKLFLKRNLADLIRRQPGERTGAPDRFTVIDVKATRRATAFHKTQVAFYVRVFEELLKEMGQARPVNAEIEAFGEIWRIPDRGTADGDEWQVERFSLAPYLRLVDEFCRDILPGIAARRVGAGTDETFFHIYFKCEQCNYLAHCSKAIAADLAANRRDVSAVPGLTHEAKRSLARLGLRCIADLSAASGLVRSPGIGWSLSRRAPQLLARAQALSAGTVARTEEEQTFLMPPRCDTVLILSIDHDPVDDRVAAIGYRRVEQGRARSERIEVPRTGSSADEADALVRVLGLLIADLTQIDATNADAEQRGDQAELQTYAHIFFYEPAEAVNLQRAIGRHLDDPRIRSGLLHLVRLFPPEDVVPEPEFRGFHHLPATAVRSVVEQLWALPVTVAYDLRQVSQALAARGCSSPYAPQPPFARPFSSLLGIEVIRQLREGHSNAAPVPAIVADVAARLDALSSVIQWIFDQNRSAAATGAPLLRLAKRPFRFQSSFDPLNVADLDALLACEIFENRAGLLEALVNLAQPAPRRRDAGRCMAGLTLRKHWPQGRDHVLIFDVPTPSRDSELGPGDINLILTDDNPDLRLDPRQWPAVSCRILAHKEEFGNRSDLVRVSVRRDAFVGQLFQRLMQRTGSGGWHIDRAFNDVTTGRAVAFLSNLAQGNGE
jgi:hypothetical protein